MDPSSLISILFLGIFFTSCHGVHRGTTASSYWPGFTLSKPGGLGHASSTSDQQSAPIFSFSADIDFTDDDLLLEMGLFVDQPLAARLSKQYPDEQDRTQAVLDAFKAVQALFDDPSFGTVRVTISVKAVIFDDKGTAQIKSDGNAETYLMDFCGRVQDLFTTTSQPTGWDVTMALTGLDIYGVLADINTDKVYAGLHLGSTRVYGVTGLSFTGGLCKSHRNCGVVEFANGGAQSVSTFAHEIGHMMGMSHDGSGNSCDSGAGKIMSLMTVKPRSGWSQCSIKSFHDLLRTTKGDCLTHLDPANH